MRHCRFTVALALAGLISAASGAGAQTPDPEAQARLELALSADATTDGTRDPVVRTRDLLRDPRWLDMLRSGFPVRLHYRLELWRSRGAWFDAFEREVNWDVVVRHEPLLDQYQVTTITPSGASENRYGTLDRLAVAIGVPYRIPMAPGDDGTFYYTITLQVTTLSDSDLDELERFLSGELGPAAGSGQDFGDAVGRGMTRLLLKLAGLPSLRLEARSGEFETTGNGE
ncbi:MAG: DUF4390 domain-containing protein [Gemmatimonadales bacterium]